jgi:hypothetical protein
MVAQAAAALAALKDNNVTDGKPKVLHAHSSTGSNQTVR